MSVEARPVRSLRSSLCIASMLQVLWGVPFAFGQCPPEWVQRFDVPAARIWPAMAYDSRREVIVMLGGDNEVHDVVSLRQVWEWDGQRWNHTADVTGGPSNTQRAEMAYDSWRGVIVVRAWRSPGPPETWEFDGLNWTLRATGGPQGAEAAMTFDSRRGVSVLWGSAAGGTWEWNGNSWTFRDAGPPSGGLELAFDEGRGVTVALGVANNQAETWEWDGQIWERVAVGGLSRRFDHAMAYDAALGEVLVYGGHVGGLELDDAWAWNGTSWRFVSAGQPSPRAFHGMAYDAVRGAAVVFGGSPEPNREFSDTWTFEEGVWTLADHGEPEARHAFSMTYDTVRSEALIFGGRGVGTLGDTWRHDGTRWRLAATTGPSDRHWPSMAYDIGRAVTVLFAGALGNEPVDGATWEWDGHVWTLRSMNGPAPRYAAAMAYDAARGLTVLFGGFAGQRAGTRFDDTWVWNGAAWNQLAVVGPSARSGAAMAYDTDREVVVLFGGFFKPLQGPNVYHQDTWEWNGINWSLRSQTGPTGRLQATMTYDQSTERMLLFGGQDEDGRQLDDLWEWDGAAWTEVQSAGPSARWSAGAVYSPSRESALLFGGQNGTALLADTWELASQTATQGDLNCDCRIDAFDIEPFIVALVDPAGYVQSYPSCSRDLADLNNDGRVDVFDIEPFAEVLVP